MKENDGYKYEYSRDNEAVGVSDHHNDDYEESYGANNEDESHEAKTETDSATHNASVNDASPRQKRKHAKKNWNSDPNRDRMRTREKKMISYSPTSRRRLPRAEQNHSPSSDDDHSKSHESPNKSAATDPAHDNGIAASNSTDMDALDHPQNSMQDDEYGDDDENEHERIEREIREYEESDPTIVVQNKIIKDTEPTTPLEIALKAALDRKTGHSHRLVNEIVKLKNFISKRKQTYKRKRKDNTAPIRALSAYNIFVQDRFARLAKENEAALKSDKKDAQMKRVPPANLVVATGNEWKELPAEEKAVYEER
jgi:hypothetical protein